jgi:hypothetical protein
MTRSRNTHTAAGDAGVFVLITAAHAAVAIPALWLWAVAWEHARRR